MLQNNKEDNKLKVLDNNKINHSKDNFMYNLNYGIEELKYKNSNILFVNTNKEVKIVDLFKEHKILTIEVIIDEIEKLKKLPISYNFLTKVDMKVSMILEEIYEPNYRRLAERFEVHKDVLCFDILRYNQRTTYVELGKLSKDLDRFDTFNNVMFKKQQQLKNMFSQYVAKYMEDMIKNYTISDSLNSFSNYSNIFFASKDLDDYEEELKGFGFLFNRKGIKEFFKDIEQKTFQIRKGQNEHIYGIDLYENDLGELEIKKVFNYLMKYKNINKISFMREEFNKYDIDNILEQIKEYAKLNLSWVENMKFLERDIKIEIYDKEFNIMSLNEEFLFLNSMKTFHLKKTKKIMDVENIYIPSKNGEQSELSFSNILKLSNLQSSFAFQTLTNYKEINEGYQPENIISNEAVLTTEITLHWKNNNGFGVRLYLPRYKKETDLKFKEFKYKYFSMEDYDESEEFFECLKEQTANLDLTYIPYKDVKKLEQTINKTRPKIKPKTSLNLPLIIETKEKDLEINNDIEYYENNIPSIKLNLIDIKMNNKGFIDLMGILNKNINTHLFSLEENDMTQNNLIWFLFNNLYKDDTKITFDSIDKINYLNLVLQVMKKDIDFLNKDYNYKIKNVVDYYNFMNKTYQSELNIKKIVEIIITRSYFNYDLVYFPEIEDYENEMIDTYNLNGIKLTNEEKEHFKEIYEKVYPIVMNDMLKFENLEDMRISIINIYSLTLKVGIELAEKNELDLIEQYRIENEDDNKEFFKYYHEITTKTKYENHDKILFDQIDTKPYGKNQNERLKSKKEDIQNISKTLLNEFKSNLENINKWFELNNELLYSVSPLKIDEKFQSILNDEYYNVLLDYETNFKPYQKDKLKEDIQKIVKRNDYKRFIEYYKGDIFSDKDVYHLNLEQTKRDLATGQLTKFPSKFEILTLEEKIEFMRDILQVNNIYNDQLNNKEKDILNAKPIDKYKENLINKSNSNIDKNFENEEIQDKYKKLLDYMLDESIVNKGEKIIEGDEFNNFAYYFKLIYKDINNLYNSGVIELEKISLIEDYIQEMINIVVDKEIDTPLELIYLKFSNEILFHFKETFIKKDDFKYLLKFEKEVLNKLIDSKNLNIEIKDNFTSIINSLKDFFYENNKDFYFYNKFDDNNYTNNYLFIYYKIIADFVNIEANLNKNILIETATILKLINNPINYKEYTIDIIDLFRRIKKDYNILYDKIKEVKDVISINNRKKTNIYNPIYIHEVKNEIEIIKEKINFNYKKSFFPTINKKLKNIYENLESINKEINGENTLFNSLSDVIEEDFKKITLENDKEVENKTIFINMKKETILSKKDVLFNIMENLANKYKVNLIYGQMFVENKQLIIRMNKSYILEENKGNNNLNILNDVYKEIDKIYNKIMPRLSKKIILLTSLKDLNLKEVQIKFGPFTNTKNKNIEMFEKF